MRVEMSMGPLRAYPTNLKPSLRIDPHKTTLKQFKRILAPYITACETVKINGVQISIYIRMGHVDSRIASDGNYLPGFNYDAIGASYVNREGETVSVNTEDGFSVEKILDYLRTASHPRQKTIGIPELNFEHKGFLVCADPNKEGLLLLQRKGRRDIKVTLASMGISEKTLNEEEVRRKIAGVIDSVLKMEKTFFKDRSRSENTC